MPLTSCVVGSYTRPEWLLKATRAYRRGAMEIGTLYRLRNQAKLLTIKEQEDAGIDYISDGEQGRLAFFEYVAENCNGFVPELVQGPVFATGEFYIFPGTVDKVSWKGEPPSASDARFLKEHTRCRVKIAVASPMIVALRMWSRCDSYPTRDSFWEEAASLCIEEVEAVSRVGVDCLQVDGTELTQLTEEDVSETEVRDTMTLYVETLNRVFSKISAPRRALHACWGNYRATHRSDGPLSKIYPYLLDVKADLLVLEMANVRRQGDELVFREYPSNKEIAAGVIDVKTPDVEPLRVVKKRVETLLKYIDKEKLWLTTDCGFAPSWDSDRIPRESCFQKLKTMSEAAKAF